MWPGGLCPCEKSPYNNRLTQRRHRKHGEGGNFGELFKRKKRYYQRISLQHTREVGFVSGNRSSETLKMDCLKTKGIESSINIVELTEVNKDWRNVPDENKIRNDTSKWKDNSMVQVSQNYHYPNASDFLVGGTASLTFGEIFSRISDRSVDERNLVDGHFFTITDKNELKLLL